MNEEDETVKKLRKELAKLTAPATGKEALALSEYKAAVNELAALEEKIQAAQKKYQDAQRALNLALLGKDTSES